jgi:UDP-2,3-diacylglucosamine hydrolase
LSAHYFISDAHLGAGPTGPEQKLFRFLDSLRGRADSLYILGDLFEFWIEYGRAIPKGGFRALSLLDELHRSGTRIGYIKGNHDFWFKDFLERELGAEAQDELDVTLDGKRLYLAHGDALDRGLVPRLFRSLVRNPVNTFLYSLLHPDLGIGLAQRVAGRSRQISAKPYLLEAMAGFAEQKLGAGFDAVVLGHSHVPELRQFGSGTYLNVGDWIIHSSYGVMRDGRLALEEFSG